jgi:hypothetical protein
VRKCLESHSKWLSRKVPWARTATRNFICSQNTSLDSPSKLSSSKNLRRCLRKGCDNRFSPNRRYQKFCNDPDCAAQLRRWQALKRQRCHRASPENRQKHAERERLRRREKAQVAAQSNSNQVPPPAQDDSRAWSRTTDIPKDFCDRPGCYEPKVQSDRNTPKFCGNDCRNAVHRVQQRNRDYKTARYRWPPSSHRSPLNYSGSLKGRIPFPQPKRSNHHGPKASPQSQPRSPPAKM